MTDSTKRHGGQKHAGPSSLSPYPVSRLAPPHDLVDVAREIEQAHASLGNVASSKLEVIANQIRSLQEQARGILEQTQRDVDLHQVRCNFHKRPGRIYHVYQRPDGRAYLSMLSPEEWGGEPPHEHLGSYRLEADMSWTPVEEIEERDRRRQDAQKLLGHGA